MKILTIIPARCGSKGIKDKNIIDVCGKPLIAYSIDLALNLKKLGFVDEVLVSTDCQAISDIANKYGAKPPFLRPKSISNDTSKSIEYCINALKYFKKLNKEFDAVLLLQPTSPIRSLDLLKKAIKLFKSEKNDSLISVYKEEYINDLVMYNNTSSTKLKPLNDNHNKGLRRQEHGYTFVRNGAIYLTRTPFLISKNLIISDNPLYVEMEKSNSINIDNIEDLKLIRKIICG